MAGSPRLVDVAPLVCWEPACIDQAEAEIASRAIR